MMTSAGEDRQNGSSSSWTRPGALLAMGVVALAVALGFAVVLSTRGSGGRSADQPGSAGPAAVAVPSVGSTSPPVTPSGTAQAVPSVAPAGVRWQLYSTVALPYSAAEGPVQVDGDVATGYAHDPVGALIASRQLSARKLLATDWRAVVRASIAPGPGRDAWVALRARYGELAPPQPGQLGQTAGFRFVDYRPDRAVIQTVSRFPTTGTLQVTTYTLAWSGRDWQLVLQPDGSDSPTGQVVASLAGFVAWGGL